MRKFFINILIFTVLIVVLSTVLLLLTGLDRNNLPAQRFSESVSFNEKIRFMEKSDIEPEVLALGSSMTLNNLHSDVVTHYLGNNYLNASAWGLNPEEDYALLKLFSGIYDLKHLLIVSSYIDFTFPSKAIDVDYIRQYLSGLFLPVLFHRASDMKLKYLIDKSGYLEKYGNCHSDYECLAFDRHGMVWFSNDTFNIRKERWDDPFLSDPASEVHYNYIDSIADYCMENNIRLYFFQAPVREGLLPDLTGEQIKMLEQHIDRVEEIIGLRGMFVDANECNWNDSLFVDGIHFSEKGARAFTEFCFQSVLSPDHDNDFSISEN